MNGGIGTGIKDIHIKRLTTDISALGVHLLTALGAALGVWALALTYDGLYKEAFWVLAVTVFIDSIDGTLARKLNIRERTPFINGTLLDSVVDYLNWTAIPLFWGYATMGLPIWVLGVCAITSSFGFSHAEAKTKDHFFRGFPSYWNIVVFYLFLLNIQQPYSSAILLILAFMTLLPVKFVYPSRTPFLQHFTLIFGILFFFQLLMLLYLFEQSPQLLIYSSFLFPAYYFGLSFYLNIKET